MTEEERLLSGKLFSPANPDLTAIKLRAHNLSTEYSALYESDYERRDAILTELLRARGNRCFFQGPIFIHYGCHTSIGENFFGNYNIVIQDDAEVNIGKNVAFGPNVTIVTPFHPLIAEERISVSRGNYTIAPSPTFAKPVNIGNNVWVGAGVTICGGVHIGDGSVIGAGSIVTRDIPNNVVAVGVPCRVIRKITNEDSVKLVSELW